MGGFSAGVEASWRAGMRAMVSTDDMQRITTAMVDAATGILIEEPDGDAEEPVYRKAPDVAAARLVCQYTIGTKLPESAPALDTLQGSMELDSIAGCRDALAKVLNAQVSGQLDHDSAASIRQSIEGVMRTHVAESGDEEAKDSKPVQVIVQSYGTTVTAEEVE